MAEWTEKDQPDETWDVDSAQPAEWARDSASGANWGTDAVSPLAWAEDKGIQQLESGVVIIPII